MLHRLAVTGYAVCLKAFSREHRDRYGREMVEAFERELSELEANRGSWSALRFVVAACLDAVSAGLGERRRRASGSRNSRVVSERAVIPSGAEALDAVVRTIRLALRRIRRSPSFTTSVVVILALGIGANAVMFGVVDRLLLSPPQHIIDAEDVRLLHVQRRLQSTGELAAYRTMSYPDYQDFLGVNAFTDVAAYTRTLEMTVGWGDAAGRARVVGVTANLFPLLGVQPASGRFFTVQVDTFADDPTAVLAHEYWVRAYGRDTGILGRTIDVGSVRLTVIGIAPAGFTGAELGPVDIWIPMSASYAVRGISGARYAFVQTVARMRPGVSVEAAEAEATARHRARDIGSSSHANSEPEVIVAPIIAALGPNPTNEARVVLWLTGVSLVVLLIACFNVASLLFARSIRTRQEIAVRLALGMSYRRLIAELVTEILVLTTMGAGAALLVARVLSGTVHQSLLPNVAFSDVSLGGRLLGFTLVATLTAGLLSGLIPALQARKVQLADALRAGGPGVAGHRSRTRVALIIGQISLSAVLLVGAGLFVRSLRTAQELDLGFDPQNIVVVALEFNEALDPTEHLAIYEKALEGIQRLPGAHSVGLTATVPFES